MLQGKHPPERPKSKKSIHSVKIIVFLREATKECHGFSKVIEEFCGVLLHSLKDIYIIVVDGNIDLHFIFPRFSKFHLTGICTDKDRSYKSREHEASRKPNTCPHCQENEWKKLGPYKDQNLDLYISNTNGLELWVCSLPFSVFNDCLLLNAAVAYLHIFIYIKKMWVVDIFANKHSDAPQSYGAPIFLKYNNLCWTLLRSLSNAKMCFFFLWNPGNWPRLCPLSTYSPHVPSLTVPVSTLCPFVMWPQQLISHLYTTSPRPPALFCSQTVGWAGKQSADWSFWQVKVPKDWFFIMHSPLCFFCVQTYQNSVLKLLHRSPKQNPYHLTRWNFNSSTPTIF